MNKTIRIISASIGTCGLLFGFLVPAAFAGGGHNGNYDQKAMFAILTQQQQTQYQKQQQQQQQLQQQQSYWWWQNQPKTGTGPT